MGAREPESTRLAGVFLARHGETAYNAEGRFQGLGTVPLNDLGLQQAHALAEIASTRGFRELWCSPLVRARETAEIVAARLALDPIEDARLVETDTGDWTDRTFASVRAEDPDGFGAYLRADPDWGYPGGETFRHQTERVMDVLGEIAQRPPPVLVVCHGMVIRLTLAALGHPVPAVPNAGLIDLGIPGPVAA
jgi:broad specificity phosphatase PhoE